MKRNKGKDRGAVASELRQRAIDTLQNKPDITEPESAETDVRRQLHELQVYRIELEMQNAELEQTRADLEASLARYTDLYDFAPVGYLTLDRKGIILDANLTGAKLLGVVRAHLPGKYFASFISDASRTAFGSFLSRAFASGAKEICELGVLDAHGQAQVVHVEAGTDELSQTCHLALLNISERKLAEEALRQSQEMLRDLVSHQEHVREDERKRIAREIHDDLGQNLLALRLDISMLHERTRHTHPRINKRTNAALAHIDATMKAVRVAINNLRPTVLDLGLAAAIEWQVRDFQQRSGIVTELAMDNMDSALDENRATALFRILQESLNNVVRHAQATRVRVHLHRDKEALFMAVADNGVGIFPECRRKANSFGLVGIAERAAALGGELQVEGSKGNGTTLTVSIPLESAASHIVHNGATPILPQLLSSTRAINSVR